MASKFDGIATILRELIETGQLEPGNQLPTIKDLVNEYGVAFETARKALKQLSDEGLINTHRGRPAVVADLRPIRVVTGDRYDRSKRERPDGSVTFQRQVARSGWKGEIVYIEVGWILCPASISHRVRTMMEGTEYEGALAAGYSTDEGVVVRRRLQVAAPVKQDGTPDEVLRRVVQLHSSWIPRWIADEVPAVLNNGGCGPGGSFSRIEEAGHPIGEFLREISYRSSKSGETNLLGLSRPTTVAVEEQVAITSRGMPVTFDRFVTLPDKVRFTFRIPHRD